jgi:hypothetical protein
MQPAQSSLQTAYQRTALQREGISFEQALETPMFKTCLTHIAEAIEKPYVPLPKHACANNWQPFKD